MKTLKSSVSHTPSDIVMENIAVFDMLTREWGENSPVVERIIKAVRAYQPLTNANEVMYSALKEIAEGKGRYSQDQFEHCRNTVSDMKALAVEAISKASA